MVNFNRTRRTAATAAFSRRRARRRDCLHNQYREDRCGWNSLDQLLRLPAAIIRLLRALMDLPVLMSGADHWLVLAIGVSVTLTLLLVLWQNARHSARLRVED